MTTAKQIKGSRAESEACKYLEQQGLSFVEKNFRCPQGEIDLIMHDKDILVFIEVRFRRKSDYGNSLETINRQKQQRVIRTARHYLQYHQLTDRVDCRFDAIGLDAKDNIIWIKDAFQVQY